MSTLGDLKARVASRYDALHLPTWPDPHDGGSPRDDEYSRVTNPERYRIVHGRARVWATVLEDVLGASSEALGGGEPLPFDRGVRLSPGKPEALPLLLLERAVNVMPGQPTLAALDIAVVRPDVVVGRWPDCGCDACDDGSDHLIQAIDESIAHIVGGPYVVLRGQSWHAEWHPGGGSASTTGEQKHDFRSLMQMCRELSLGNSVRLPERSEAFVGQSWTD